MILPRLLLSASSLVAVVGLADPSVSFACGGFQCGYDQFVPRSGSVPANLPAVAWRPGYDSRGGSSQEKASLPHFECVAADGSKHDVAFVALPEDNPDRLELAQPLIAGEHCTITSGVTDCSIDDPDYTAAAEGDSYLAGRAELDIVAESPLPDVLGLLAVTGAEVGDLNVAADSSCSENIEVCSLTSTLDFSEAALPWKDALLFETYVDGARFSTSRNLSVPTELGGLYSGRENDVVYVPLGTIPKNVVLGTALDSGEHNLQLRARLPGSAETLTTPPLTVVLSCGNDPETPLAPLEMPSSSDGCAVASLGSAQRPLVGVLFGVVALLLTAARRRRW